MTSTGAGGDKQGVITPTLAFAALVAGAMAMGVSPVFVRTAEIGPFASAFWRVFTALPVLVAWAMFEVRRQAKETPLAMGGKSSPLLTFAPPVLLSGLFFAGDLTFWHLAIMNTTMANATMMSCLAPVWVLLLSGAFIGEPVPKSSFLGLALCLGGAAMLVGSSYSIDPSRIIGDVYGLITSVFFGLYFLAIRVGRRQAGGGVLTLSSTIVTAILLLAVALVSGNAMLPQTAQGYASLAALGLVSHAGGQGMLTLALGVLSAAFSSLVIFLEAFAAAFFGWLFFGETLGAMQVAGSILILGGVWVARPRS
jgi:drug/metabolite transporter (DMT)-like permease